MGKLGFKFVLKNRTDRLIMVLRDVRVGKVDLLQVELS